MFRLLAFATIALLGSIPASAAESVTYTYDSLGRLVQATTSGSINSGFVEATTFDPSDNRSNYALSGSPLLSQPVPVVVVPLNGLTVIPLPYPVQ